MITRAHVEAATLLLPRDAQIAEARTQARQVCADQGHVLSAWRHAGHVADDEAVCRICGAWLFIVYGSSGLQPLIGARVFGMAFGSACRPTPPAGRRD